MARSTHPAPLLVALLVAGLLGTVVWACSAGPATGATPAAITATDTPAQSPAPPSPATASAPTTATGGAPRAAATPVAAPRQPLPAGAAGGPAQAPSTGWHQLNGNPQRTGYTPVELGGNVSFKWVWNGPARPGDGGAAPNHLALPKAVQPVIGGGLLYVGHSDGVLRAISVATGVEAWQRAVGGQILGTAAYDSARGRVIAASTSGRVVSINAADGRIADEFNAGGPVELSPLLVGDTVYVGTISGQGEATSGRLYALDADSFEPRWSYETGASGGAGAGIVASPAYAGAQGGMVIVASEDKFVHAVRASDGSRLWRVAVHADRDPNRNNRAFPDTFPVVSEANNAVVIRSYFDWMELWGSPQYTDSEQIRSWLQRNPQFQSLFVLDLASGNQKFVAPVYGGGIGNNDDFYSSPPQVVVRPIPGAGEVAYVLWRNLQGCVGPCDQRDEGVVGEMNLATGAIRFVEEYKNSWQWRMPTDEFGAMTMAGDTLFFSHWMAMAGLEITDRSPGLGATRDNPIKTRKFVGVTNTVRSGDCPGRVQASHYCPSAHNVPGDDYLLDPGFYIYYHNARVYDQFFTPPVSGPAIDEAGNIYWKSVDGAIIALATGGGPAPTPVATPSPGPSGTPIAQPYRMSLPVLRK